MKQFTARHGFKALLAAILTLCFAVATLSSLTLSFAEGYDQVASKSDMTTVETVGVEGMTPIAPKDVENGTYEVEMESSSSMFKIEKAVLEVTDDAMNVTMTLSGKYSFTVPVANLDEGFPCAAFSQRKQMWYDRNLLVRAQSLPEGAVKVELPDYEELEKAAQEKRIAEMQKEQDEKLKALATDIDLHNGSYSVEVDMTGGSGRASITSPTTLTVIDGKAFATIQWSSPNYDYMIVGGEKLTPQNVEEGSNSSFLIPVLKFDEPFKVIGDTTAMSTPHEVEYELTFHQDSVKRYSSSLWVYMLLAFLFVLAAAFGVYYFWVSDWGKKKKK